MDIIHHGEIMLRECRKVPFSILCFFWYINDIPIGINSVANLFADDTSIFSDISDVNKSFEELDSDLLLINKWAYHRKISFNRDPNKQAAEVIFSLKKNPPANLTPQHMIYENVFTISVKIGKVI